MLAVSTLPALTLFLHCTHLWSFCSEPGPASSEGPAVSWGFVTTVPLWHRQSHLSVAGAVVEKGGRPATLWGTSNI